MPPSMFLKSHCAWTHTVWIRLLYWDVIIYDWWGHSMCLAAYHNCNWSCYSFAVDHTYVLQLHDVIGRTSWRNVNSNIVTSLNDITSATVRCNVHHSCLTTWNKIIGQDCWPSSSSSSTYDAATPLSPTFIFVSDYNFNIYIHRSINTTTTVLL